MKPYGFIYITTNKINNKKYIGQRTITNTPSDDTYLGSGYNLQKAIQKYGQENFTREILDYAYSEKELGEKEVYYISLYDATKDRNFYNIHVGGFGGNTIAGWSEERLELHKKRMSEVTSGDKNGMYGRKHSEETKKKISQIRLQKERDGEYDDVYHSKAFRDKMSKVTSGERNGMYGKKHSEEAKKKMSENSKGLNKGIKNGNYGNVGDKAKNGKPVYKYADKKHTVLIKRYNTVRQVLSELGLKGHVGLVKAIKDNKKYKGYYWSK